MTGIVCNLDGIDRVRVVVGLGNPGRQYLGTRHNLGFAVVDKIASRLNLDWKRSGDAEWAVVPGDLNLLGCGDGVAEDLVLCKPLTFMNRSGDVFGQIKADGVAPDEMLVVHDELEKPLGYVGVRLGGSARGHNGLRSFISRCDNDFWRLRIGIGRPDKVVDVGDFVLGRFTPDEKLVVDVAVVKAAGLIARI